MYTSRQRTLNQLHYGKVKFLKRFNQVNALYHNNYEIKAPKGHVNRYLGMKHQLWFYHKLCHRYFKTSPNHLLKLTRDNGTRKKYLCSYCNKKLGRKIVSLKARKRCRSGKQQMMNHTTALKIKKQHLQVAKISFEKKFSKTVHAKDFTILLKPDNKPDVYRGMNKPIWVLHNYCHHFFRTTPQSLLRTGRVYSICPFCRHCQVILNALIRYKNRHKHFHRHSISSYYHKGTSHIPLMNRKIKSSIKHVYHHGNPGGRRTNTSFLRDVYAQPDNHNHTYTPVEKYKGNMVKIHWLYWGKHRAYPFVLTPNEFLNQGIRYKHNRRYRYKGERAVKEYCDYYGLRENIDYFHSFILPTNKSTALCLHADFYLPNIIYSPKYYNGIVIEYDGSQHFQASKHFGGNKALKNRQKRDHHKDIFCEKHHIKMIRIEKYHRNPHHYAYIKKLVIKTLNKKLLPTLYRNYLSDVDLQH